MCAYGFRIIISCQCGELLCNILSSRRFVSFFVLVLFLIFGFLLTSRQVQLMNFHFTTSYLTRLLYRWSFLKKRLSQIAKIKNDFLRGMCIEWDFDCLWGGCVNVRFPPRSSTSRFFVCFLTTTIGCCHTFLTELEEFVPITSTKVQLSLTGKNKGVRVFALSHFKY